MNRVMIKLWEANWAQKNNQIFLRRKTGSLDNVHFWSRDSHICREMSHRDGQTSFITSDVLFTSTSVPLIAEWTASGVNWRGVGWINTTWLFILRSYGKKVRHGSNLGQPMSGLGCIKRKKKKSDLCCSGGYENIRYRSHRCRFLKFELLDPAAWK